MGNVLFERIPILENLEEVYYPEVARWGSAYGQSMPIQHRDGG